MKKIIYVAFLILAPVLVLILILLNIQKFEVEYQRTTDHLGITRVDTNMIVGFATVNGTVTGGENGQTLTVSNATEFLKAVKVSKPLVIQV